MITRSPTGRHWPFLAPALLLLSASCREVEVIEDEYGGSECLSRKYDSGGEVNTVVRLSLFRCSLGK